MNECNEIIIHPSINLLACLLLCSKRPTDRSGWWRQKSYLRLLTRLASCGPYQVGTLLADIQYMTAFNTGNASGVSVTLLESVWGDATLDPLLSSRDLAGRFLVIGLVYMS